MTLAAPGSVGVKREEVGAISGEEVTSSVITQPMPMVVKRYGTRPGERVVALTFDDGPWPGQTNRILHILKQYNVRASFFMLGYLSKRNSALARQVADEGHLVGNHTIGHRTLTRLTTAAVDDQIERGEVAIAKSTGVTPAWFRPPGGHISAGVWSRVNHANLRVALWDVDPQDWRSPTPNQIAHNVVVNTRPGSIVLLHDGGGNRESTIRALPIIIRSLQSRGYKFVTLDELPGS
jgi:peptidoglycan/xylan/chitin deacetylase (PgdA/CDA1 family)